jgi:DnaA regulatory inactivator Hda
MTRQYPLPLPHREAMEADDYLVTASNREASAWVNKWPEWPSHGLLILGPSGSGKTHLLNLWLKRSNGILVTPDDLKTKDARELTANGMIIAVDDVGQIAGDAIGEEILFHLHNIVRDAKGSLLLTASDALEQKSIKLADLRSRLLALPVAAIEAPDDELLSMLLVKQFHDRQIEISADVITYLLPRIERTTAALRELVAKLDRVSLAERRGITVALTKQVLKRKD